MAQIGDTGSIDSAGAELTAAINPQTSFNFTVAKVLAILLVVTGHFFGGSLLWIPVTVGLFVFAYSSAYFTSVKYGDRIEQKLFWLNKIGRLAIPFWLTQGFLLVLFLATGREGIWTWQTIVHWLGQSGWLNWFGVSNDSPFGAGLWFFTLLLIFYLLYPVLSRWNGVSARAHLSLAIAIVLTLVLDHQIKVGHALWLTAFAFWFGVYAARNPVGGSATGWFFVAGAGALIMLATNHLGVKAFNPVLLVAISIAATLWIDKAVFPRTFLSWTILIHPALLEIYLIHTYLFVDQDLPNFLRFAISIVLVLVSALVLAWMSRRISGSTKQYQPNH